MSISTTPITFAIIGTGLIGPRHATTVLQNPDCRLQCIVDPNPAAKEVAANLGCPIYSFVESMLSTCKPQAAIVCTPNHTHVSISKQLLEAGIHVLCEKPISVDVESGKELVDCAAKTNVHLLIGHHRRFNPYVVAAKQSIPAFGRLIAVNGLWTIYKPASYFDPPTDWRRLDSAGPIFINLIHDVDILHHLFGPITRVYAEQTISQRGFDAEEGAAITLRFKSGMVGTFLLSDAVVSPHNFESGTGENPMIPKTGQDFYRIFGSEGSLSVPDLTMWKYADGKKSWSEDLEKVNGGQVGGKAPFELQIEHFIRVIRGEEGPSCDGEEGLRAVRVCEGVKRSMREGRPVEIS